MHSYFFYKNDMTFLEKKAVLYRYAFKNSPVTDS